MQDLLNFVDEYTFESQLYFRVGSSYNQDEYEVQWLTGPVKIWQIKAIESCLWVKMTSGELINYMNDLKIDLNEFEQMLRANILQQVVYVDSFMDQAKKIFGESAIKRAVESNRRFLSELETTIKSLVKDSHSSNENKSSHTALKKEQPRRKSSAKSHNLVLIKKQDT